LYDSSGVDAGDLRFGFYEAEMGGVAVDGMDNDTVYPVLGASTAQLAAFADPTNQGTYIKKTLLHEIGHALGIGHSDSTGMLLVDYTALGDVDEETAQYTVMSYHSHPAYRGETLNESIWPSTLMLYDIAALQELWGKNTASDEITEYSWA